MTTETQPPHDLARAAFGLLFLTILVVGSFWVLRPFLPALVWATMIVVATWPMLLAVQARLGGRRAPAVLLMTLALLLVLIVPLTLAITSIADHADQLADLSRSFGSLRMPPPPEWLASLPLVGSRIAAEWQQVAQAGPGGLVARIAPHVGNITRWLATQAGSLGLLLLHLLLTVVLSAILYAAGETAATGVRRFFHRLAGERGDGAVQLAARAVRAVALGVIVTALAQSLVAGVGLVATGIPYAGPLTAVIFILCIAQLGPGLVLVPAVVWLFWSDQQVAGSVLVVFALVAGTLDNFLRPILIRRGADLPLLLIFAGVIGGLLGFGVIGLFIGPVILAVSYTLVGAWIADATPDMAPPETGDLGELQ